MIVAESQSVLDFCIEKFGSLENLYDILVVNNISASQYLQAGQDLIVNNTGAGDEDVKSFYKLKNIVPSNDQGNGNPINEVGDYNGDYNNDYN